MIIGDAIKAFGTLAHVYQDQKRKKVLKPVYGMMLFMGLKEDLISLARERNGGPVFTPTLGTSQILRLAEILPGEAGKYRTWISLVMQRPLGSYAKMTSDGSYYDRLENTGYKLLESLSCYSPHIDREDSWLKN